MTPIVPRLFDRRPRRTAIAPRVLLTVAALCLVSGCGYSQREPFPEQYTAVAVPIFENASFERGVEFDFAEALTKELRSRTPYRVRRADIADTLLDGRITRVDRDLLSRREVGGVPQEVEVTVSLDFTWVDAQTGETILDRRGFEAVGRHIPTSPVGEPYEVAQREAVERLARDVVTAMRSDWSSP
ncbi:MAG: LptE family protein [Phycisphaeraceae bacterium]